LTAFRVLGPNPSLLSKYCATKSLLQQLRSPARRVKYPSDGCQLIALSVA